ncbi:MAG: hypothetical protein KC646_09635 [Candidatus Cloacimonetes bacterium]|nr:hypothetical protein [Candidatus Cloacimonadota bacterium]
MLGFLQEESNSGFPNSQSLWLHAVSFGETKIALEFLKEGIQNQSVPTNICFTTTIEDAMIWFQQESKTLSPHVSIYCYFLPLDCLPVMFYFIHKIKAKSLFLSETDFWPSILWLCKQKKIPVYLINGRISKTLSNNLLRFQKSSIKMLQAIDLCFVQYPNDKSKLEGLIKQDNIHVYGNAKFDLLHPQALNEKYSALKLNDRQACVLGSFHPDECKLFLTVFKQFSSQLLFVIAPRNLNSITALKLMLDKNKLSYDLSSQIPSLESKKDIIILDEMGVLSSLYQYCNISVIGGSFNQVGGHNFLEPILYKKPVFVGPFFRNFEHDIQEFLKLNYIWQVSNEKEISRHFTDYLNNPKPYIESSLKANQHLKSHQGVLQKTWNKIN